MYQYADYLHIISVLLEDYAKESLLDTQNIYIQPTEPVSYTHLTLPTN